MIVENLFETRSCGGEREEIQHLLETDAVRIERIESHGQASPDGFWYDQPHGEWVVLLRGLASLAFSGDETIDLKAGDALLIPARRKHRVERSSVDALWLAVHLCGGAPVD